MPNVIETINLTKQYRNQTVVNQLNLEVQEGQIHGFLGPNGAGKTTTIKMLLDLITPTSGRIELFGMDLQENRNEILHNIGAFVDSPSYYGHLTGYENLLVIQKMLGKDEEAIIETLETVGLLHAKDKLAKEYSLGMRQRLGLAFALLNKPKLLILDEPTNGLDPSGIHEIRQLIKSLAYEKGYTIFLSSHNLNEIELLASHVSLIQEGHLLYQGSLEEVLKEGDQVEIGTNDLLQAKDLLRHQGFETELNKEKGILTTHGKNQSLAVMNQVLVHAGFEVFHLYRKRRTLEETFLALTGRSEVRQ
ncbi:ABC transporter ATP-binding protein [Halalkalibacter alkalisediminis]|uniref:ABC transporter ATP-binding protein n=1 Tax=Halalkalibacter alkalisediminis TaxID=935616 RepID=A0ABV6NKQ5_9BACI|nr:ABC transporter ATP-binding protein [Halalkalibacter alkalisediminis]